MSEKGQPLPYTLEECAGCRDLKQQLAQKQVRIQELEQALRLQLAVDPDDPLVLSTIEQQLAEAQAEIAQYPEGSESTLRQWYAMKQERDQALAEIARLKALANVRGA